MSVFSVTTLLVALCAIGLVSAENPAPGTPGFRCQPGSTFQFECNQCSCSSDGTTAGCTYRGCPKQKRQISPAPNTDGFTCTPGKKFSHECNQCTCSSNGVNAACTLKACPREKRAASSPEAPDVSCTPGSTFKAADGCNDCTCSENGKVAACTLKLCLPKQKRSVQAPDVSCTPGSTFKSADGCNDCTCSKNGKVAACTEKLCLTKKKRSVLTPGSPGFSCTPGEEFQWECNNCKCASDGKEARCTRKVCPRKQKRSVPESPEPGTPGFKCTPKLSFPDPDGCNTCTCADDGKNAYCTLKACRSHHVKQKREADVCESGESMKQDCNNCKCIKGNWACTRMACPHKQKRDTRDRANDKNCTPGHVTMKDCNKCSCVTGVGIICTKRLCSKSTTVKPAIQKRDVGY